MSTSTTGVVHLPTGTFTIATARQRIKARTVDVTAKIVSQFCGAVTGAVGATFAVEPQAQLLCWAVSLWMGFVGYDLLAMRITGRRAWGKTSFGRQLAGIVVLDARTGQPVDAVKQRIRDFLGNYMIGGPLWVYVQARRDPNTTMQAWHDRICGTYVVQVQHGPGPGI
ncbi:RDD family protein [Streptomyces pactum]|uniref:RDD family protein n=1 Tax=Streptomyces pactum TaxID=68249 RepID=UPI0036FFF9F5